MLTSLRDADIAGKRVLVRVDFNVPLAEDGEVVDDVKIMAALPTLRYLEKNQAAQIILLTHLGNPVVRPREKLDRTIKGNQNLRLGEVARRLQECLDLKVTEPAETELPPSPLPAYRVGEKIFLLENLRFDPREQANDQVFGQLLASLGDVFVNEAFPETHREVASLVQIPKHLPSVAGFHLMEELTHLDLLVQDPPKSTVVVLGGAKIHDKALLIDALLKKVDYFLLGGVMANTFLAAQGVDVKKSVVETDRIPLAKQLLNRAPQKFILPIDLSWERDRALDIGPQTQALFARHLERATLSFWNGPMGWTAAGRELFFHGSEQVARAMANGKGQTIVAGGDTLEVVDRYHLARKFTFCSTGGGATLAYLAGEELPGLIALEKKN